MSFHKGLAGDEKKEAIRVAKEQQKKQAIAVAKEAATARALARLAEIRERLKGGGTRTKTLALVAGGLAGVGLAVFLAKRKKAR